MVVVRDAPRSAVDADADAFGTAVHDVIRDLIQNDVGDMVAHWVPVAEGQHPLSYALQPVDDSAAEVGHVVRDVGRENLVQVIELAPSNRYPS